MTTNKLLLCFSVCIWILLVPFITLGQDIQRTPTVNGGSVAAVSFAFSSTTEGASIRQGEGDDNRYYVRVPIANNPLADPDPQVELRVERDKSDKEFLVYSFPMEAGTSPQVHFERASLRIRFTLPSSLSRDNSTPAAKGSTVTGVASGMNTGILVRRQEHQRRRLRLHCKPELFHLPLLKTSQSRRPPLISLFRSLPRSLFSV
jgi:hypothetical protein